MDYRQMFYDLIYAIVTICVPIVVSYLVEFLKKKSQEVESMINNEYLGNIVNIVDDVIVMAVADVSQTYVDMLKKEGKFDKDAQTKAFNMAVDKIYGLISEDMRTVIDALYGNFYEYVKVAIECAVAENKK